MQDKIKEKINEVGIEPTLMNGTKYMKYMSVDRFYSALTSIYKQGQEDGVNSTVALMDNLRYDYISKEVDEWVAHKSGIMGSKGKTVRVKKLSDLLAEEYIKTL